jgi:hypothetical protein
MSMTRRAFLGGASGLGAIALASLRNEARAQQAGLPHFTPKAKRVVWLFASGGPSQMELFDYKPVLREMHGQLLPESVRMGQRLTTMSSGQSRLELCGSAFEFAQHGQSGAWLSELLPSTAQIVDRLCIVNSMYTEPINHDPAMTLMHSGSETPGRPSVGSWASYGLGSEAEDLPAFVVMLAKNTTPEAQPLYNRLWSSGFLPSAHQGVQLRTGGDPVLFLDEGAELATTSRRALIDRITALDRLHRTDVNDPELDTKIEGYELAFRMQTGVPELADLSSEPEETFALYGEDARQPGTHARNCLLTRRLLERGVRFVQLYHRDWDHHAALPERLRHVTGENERASAALVIDLERRGLLEDTLVIWGGEFGRTSYAHGLAGDGRVYGRDHHPRCFSMWLAGGGIKPGLVYGKTDDFSYNVVENAVHVNDLHATILHLLGIDHLRFTYRHLGRDFRLTDVAGRVVESILA